MNVKERTFIFQTFEKIIFKYQKTKKNGTTTRENTKARKAMHWRLWRDKKAKDPQRIQ